jgi:hypothetical protein
LVESFNITPTDYGTNEKMNDSKFNRRDENETSTFYSFFKVDDFYFDVTFFLRKNDVVYEVGFGRSIGDPLNLDNYSDKRINYKDNIGIYNKIIFITKEFVEKYDIKSLAFSYADDKRNKVYSKMIENDSFKRIINKIGFKFVGNDKKYYYFDRKENNGNK